MTDSEILFTGQIVGSDGRQYVLQVRETVDPVVAGHDFPFHTVSFWHDPDGPSEDFDPLNILDGALYTFDPRNPNESELIGIKEISDLLSARTGDDVPRNRVDQWAHEARKASYADPVRMPAPRATVGGRPAWLRTEILQWAEDTGKL